MTEPNVDREMLIRIDERVNGLVLSMNAVTATFREQYSTKTEVSAVINRVSRIEWVLNLVSGAVILAIVGAIMTLILRGPPA